MTIDTCFLYVILPASAWVCVCAGLHIDACHMLKLFQFVHITLLCHCILKVRLSKQIVYDVLHFSGIEQRWLDAAAKALEVTRRKTGGKPWTESQRDDFL